MTKTTTALAQKVNKLLQSTSRSLTCCVRLLHTDTRTHLRPPGRGARVAFFFSNTERRWSSESVFLPERARRSLAHLLLIFAPRALRWRPTCAHTHTHTQVTCTWTCPKSETNQPRPFDVAVDRHSVTFKPTSARALAFDSLTSAWLLACFLFSCSLPRCPHTHTQARQVLFVLLVRVHSHSLEWVLVILDTICELCDFICEGERDLCVWVMW